MFENSHGKIDLGEAVHDLCYGGLTLKEEQQCSWSILRGCTSSLQHLSEEKKFNISVSMCCKTKLYKKCLCQWVPSEITLGKQIS